MPPTDKLQDLRSEIMLKLIDAGVQVEVQHHEVGTAGQAEIDMRFDSLTKMGDKMMVYKYVIKNVAAQHGYVATFMPKPLFQDNGSACTCTRACGRTARTCSPTSPATPG